MTTKKKTKKESFAMKRARDSSADGRHWSAAKRSMQPYTVQQRVSHVEYDPMETIRQMQTQLVQCETNLERIRREVTFGERRACQQRAQELNSEIVKLRNDLAFVKQGLLAVRRGLEKIPHHTAQGSSTVHQQVMSIFNDVASNYNMLQRRVQDY